MAAVNWTDPSEGIVSDPKPALTLQNNKDGALVTKSRGVGILARSPGNTAVLGGNQTGVIPALGGASVVNPSAPSSLGGIGVIGATNRPAATGVAGVALRERSIGVLGLAENLGRGLVGRGEIAGVEGTAKQGHGVQGYTQSQGNAAGVYGYGAGDGGAGVRGIGVAGAGVEGRSAAGPGVHASSDQAQGVVGEAQAPNAAGIFGRNDGLKGVGVDGYSQVGIAVRASSSSGVAVDAETLNNTAVFAQNMSAGKPTMDVNSLGGGLALKAYSQGRAVDVQAAEAGIYAVAIGSPSSDPSNAAAIQGVNFGKTGVKGASALGIGVHGVGFPVLGGLAGFFEGDVRINGLLFKYASLFSIDHPLDPDRKLLNHAAVEAPEYKTFYDGVVRLDKTGKALVRLPRWFAALNGQTRYQLTAIGAPGPNLHVRSAGKDSFVVAGGGPGQKVCWQVTGVRRDAWARAHPLQVEQSKRSALPKVAPTSLADLKRQVASLKKTLAQGRKPAPARPARAARPPITRQVETGPSSRAVDKQAKSVIKEAKKAMK